MSEKKNGTSKIPSMQTWLEQYFPEQTDQQAFNEIRTNPKRLAQELVEITFIRIKSMLEKNG